MAKVDPISNEIYDIEAYAPMSGRVLGEDGKAYNIVELAVPVTDKIYDIENYAPMSGRVLGEDGKVYSLVELLRNAGGSDFFKSVATFADLPQPASGYADELYFVQENTGGIFAFMGIYKYPRGFYAANADGEWEQVPISVAVSEDAFTVANITDWAAFAEFAKNINAKDVVLYDGILYQNKSGIATTIPPVADEANWAALRIGATKPPLFFRREMNNESLDEVLLQIMGIHSYETIVEIDSIYYSSSFRVQGYPEALKYLRVAYSESDGALMGKPLAQVTGCTYSNQFFAATLDEVVIATVYEDDPLYFMAQKI